MALLPGIESHINRFLFREMCIQVYVCFVSLLRQNYNLQLEPSADKAGRLESCSICSGEGDMEKEEEEVPWCSRCCFFQELGTALRQAMVLCETQENCQFRRFF